MTEARPASINLAIFGPLHPRRTYNRDENTSFQQDLIGWEATRETYQKSTVSKAQYRGARPGNRGGNQAPQAL